MKFLEILFPKKMKKKDEFNRSVPFYLVKPFEQLKIDLKYASHTCLYDEAGVYLTAKFNKGILYKVCLVSKFDEYLNVDLSNENLIIYNQGKELEPEFNFDYLEEQKVVYVTIFKEKSERTIEYCRKHAKCGKEFYQQYLVVDKTDNSIVCYRPLPDYIHIYQFFNKFMYIDLAAHDLEVH